MAIELVYCAGGNRRYAEIAIVAGFRYGAQLPDTVYFPPWFADQNWKKPNRRRYMAALAQHRPHMASVLDWERSEQLPEVLDWAEEAAQFVNVVMIIPKVIGEISRIPRRVGSADVRLGYSVPTKFSGTELPPWEFAGWPVHLLGGSPHAQMRLAHYMDVHSADGNMTNRLASYCMFWVPGTAHYASNRWWPTMREANDGTRLETGDLPYVAFRRSCENIVTAWKNIHDLA